MLKKSFIILLLISGVCFNNVSFAVKETAAEKAATEKAATEKEDERLDEDYEYYIIIDNLDDANYSNEDIANANEWLYKNSIEYERVQTATSDVIKAKVWLNSVEEQIEVNNANIKQLEKDLASEESITKKAEIQTALDEANTQSDSLVTKENKAREILEGSNTALSVYKMSLWWESDDLNSSYDAVIEEQKGKIISETDLAKLDGEELEAALLNNGTANQIVETFAAKKLAQAEEDFANSADGIMLQNAIDNAETPEAKTAAISAFDTAETTKTKTEQTTLTNAQSDSDTAHTALCDETNWCIEKASFEISVNDISPWMGIITGNSNQTINKALWTIIQKLMIGLWSLSLLIMTVGAWYIILHNWQDELLSKWKSIFMSWVYAMMVSLSSYYLIMIVRYIIYA